MIPFTQYLMPDGRQKEISIERPPLIESLARQAIEAGAVFETEVLSTGEVSLTMRHCDDEEHTTLCIEVCSNGPSVLDAVDKLVCDSHAALVSGPPDDGDADDYPPGHEPGTACSDACGHCGRCS